MTQEPVDPALVVFGASADTVALKCHISSHFESEVNVTDSLAGNIIWEKPVPI